MARHVIISAISCSDTPGSFSKPRDAVDAGLKSQLEWIDRAAFQTPDVIVLPEVCAWRHVPIKQWPRYAQTERDPVFVETADRARKHRCYIACPILLRKGDNLYNSFIVVDREGKRVGRYDKMVPTADEMRIGVRPGRKNRIVRTKFGTFAFAICFDMNFEEVFRSAKQQGAEVILFGSMYPGGFQCRVWAYQYELFIVGASSGTGSMLVNPVGRIITESQMHQQIKTTTLNLDCRVLHLDDNMKKFPAIEKKYGRLIEIDVLSPEAIFLLTSHHPRKSVDDIIKEFKLETRQAYYARTRRARNRSLNA